MKHVTMPFEAYRSVVVKFNQALAGQIAYFAELQMNSLKKYTDLGLAQIKVASSVSDTRGLQEFVESQSAVASFLNQQLANDSQALAKWGYDCYVQADSLVHKG